MGIATHTHLCYMYTFTLISRGSMDHTSLFQIFLAGKSYSFMNAELCYFGQYHIVGVLRGGKCYNSRKFDLNRKNVYVHTHGQNYLKPGKQGHIRMHTPTASVSLQKEDHCIVTSRNNCHHGYISVRAHFAMTCAINFNHKTSVVGQSVKNFPLKLYTHYTVRITVL